MSKRALTRETIAVIIIAIICLIVLLVFTQKLFAGASGKTEKDICKTSVASSALLRFGNLEFNNNIKCTTQSIDITKADEELAKKTIAKAMYDCWDQFLEGKKLLFSGEGRICHICSIIHFEETAQKMQAINGLYAFLNTRTAPLSSKSYLDFITNDNAEKIISVLEAKGFKLGEEKMPTNTPYAVYFVYDKGTAMTWPVSTIPAFVEAKTTETTKTQESTVHATGSAVVVPALLVAFALGAGGAAAWTIVHYSEGGQEWRATLALGEYTPEKLAELGCTRRVGET